MSYRTDGQRSTGQVVKEITEDLSTLVRKEIELAKLELKDSVTAKLKGAVIIAIVGVMGVLALLFALLAVRDAVNLAVPDWAAAWAGDVAVLIVLAIAAGIAALVAKSKLSTPISADLTRQTIKDDVEWAKQVTRR